MLKNTIVKMRGGRGRIWLSCQMHACMCIRAADAAAHQARAQRCPGEAGRVWGESEVAAAWGGGYGPVLRETQANTTGLSPSPVCPTMPSCPSPPPVPPALSKAAE